MHWRTVAGLMAIFFMTEASPSGFGNDFPRSDNPDLGWQPTGATADLAIYSRPHPGSAFREFKGVGTIDAPTYAVQAVLESVPLLPLPDESTVVVPVPSLNPYAATSPAG